MRNSSPGQSLWRMGRLIRKELSTILRDRRTIITLVLMPVLLYPLLTIAFRQFLLVSAADQKADPEFVLSFESPEDRDRVNWFLALGVRALRDPRRDEPSPKLMARTDSDPRQTVLSRQADLGIRLRKPRERSASVPGIERAMDLEVFYLEDSPPSLDALAHVQRLLDAAHRQLLFQRRKPLADRFPAADGVVLLRPRLEAMQAPDSRSGVSLSALIPLVLILMTITGAVYPAIDLTAGERERGTLEILVAAPIPRLELLFAKYVSVVAVAVLTALINLGTMLLTLQLSGLGERVFGGGLSPLVIVQVFFLLLLFAAFFSAVLLTVTSFARSFKEGQAYLIPLMLVSLAPGMLSLLPGLKLAGGILVVPLLNIVLLGRDLLDGQATTEATLIVVLTTLLYALAAIALAARIFGAEAVLYSEQTGWGDLFRRPATPRPAATTPSALFCLAVLFPVAFVMQSLLSQVASAGTGVELGVSAAGAVLLFLVLPLLFAWVGRVRFRSGFRLERSGAAVWGAMLLFGVAVWPFADLVREGLARVGVSTITEDVLRLFQKQLESWRQWPVSLVILCMAVVPAVLEELFFRGFLFASLPRVSPPATVIVLTAVFFGLFHFVGPLLSVERGVTSTLLGLLLGWIAWRTGSVVPGMILHAVHNSCLILMAYYKSELISAGWFSADRQSVPPVYLLTGLGLVIVAVVWIFLATRVGVDSEIAGE